MQAGALGLWGRAGGEDGPSRKHGPPALAFPWEAPSRQVSTAVGVSGQALGGHRLWRREKGSPGALGAALFQGCGPGFAGAGPLSALGCSPKNKAKLSASNTLFQTVFISGQNRTYFPSGL